MKIGKRGFTLRRSLQLAALLSTHCPSRTAVTSASLACFETSRPAVHPLHYSPLLSTSRHPWGNRGGHRSLFRTHTLVADSRTTPASHGPLHASRPVASPRPNLISPPWRPAQPPCPLLRAASFAPTRSRPPNGMRGGEREGEGEEGREGEEEFAEMGEGDEELVEIDCGGGQDGVRRKGGGAGKGGREWDVAAGGIGNDDVLSADFDDDDAPAELAHDGMGQEEGEEDEEAGQDDSVHVFTAHTDSVYAVACSPLPGGRVASGGGDEVGYLWTIGQAEDPIKLEGHRDSIAAVEFSADGRWVATAGLDGVVMLWDAATGERRHRLEGPGEGIEFLTWHPRGAVVLAGSEDLTAWMWNAETGACMAVFTGHSAGVTCGAFSPDGRAVWTGSTDGSVRCWDPRSAATTATLAGPLFHSDAITCVAMAPQGSVGAAGSSDHTTALFGLQQPKVLGLLTGHTDSVEAVVFNPQGPTVATASLDGSVRIFDINSLQLRSTCTHQDGVVQMAWAPAAPVLVTATADGAVHVWDARSGAIQNTLRGNRDAVLSLALTPDAAFAVTGSDDHTARVFQL
ncbi:unnamed protein product [Closterium sp. Naga37s-1]|nr:unnamed protein product [Closterium sp. Naga37s-1]